MARKHEIAIAADTRDFERGIRDGIIDPLDDAERNLDQLGDAAEAAGRDSSRGLDKIGDAAEDAGRESKRLGDDLKDAGRDGERAVDRLEDALRDAQRQTDKLGDDARDAGRDMERGMKDAEGGVEEFKDEANSTAREAAASFDGSAESIVDAFQEVAANAFVGFGPAGAVAGLAAAAGIGLVVKGFEEAEEAREESEERIGEWADAFIEAGNRVLSAAQVTEKARAIITDTEKFKEAQDAATAWGVSESLAILAISGDTNALAEARDALADKERDLARSVKDTSGAFGTMTEEQKEMSFQIEFGKKILDQMTSEMESGEHAAGVYSESLRLLAKNTAGATTEIDEFGDSIVTLPDGKTIYIDAETGRATDSVDAIEDKIYGLKGKTVSVGVNTSAASAGLNRWISQNGGRTIKIYGRYVSPAGADIYP